MKRSLCAESLLTEVRMDHSDAMRMQAAERYILGELSTDERGEFEDHLFTCLECADEVRAGAMFIDNAKAVLAEGDGGHAACERVSTAQHKPDYPQRWWHLWHWWREAIPAMAAVSLFAVLGYQNLVQIPALKAVAGVASRVQPVSSIVLPPGTRGDAPVLRLLPEDRFVHLSLDMNSGTSVSNYECDLQDAQGRLIFSSPVSATGETLQLLVPVHLLHPGRYTLIVRLPRSSGLTAAEVERSPFEVRAPEGM